MAEIEIYEMSIVVRVTWQAHSLSNVGNNGSIRTMPRRQLLADGTETDACSGNIAKYHHAELLVEYAASEGVPVCAACRVHDGRRAFALDETGRTMESIISGCMICDTHGFLIPARNANVRDETVTHRDGLAKASLFEYSMALAIPGSYTETTHLHTRSGDGQMLMKIPARSGEYATCIRYRTVGVGVDTECWKMIVTDQRQRQKRHKANLSSLRDQMLSPDGALTAKLLPHLTGLKGAIMLKTSPGRAPLYSGLEADFLDRLKALSIVDCQILEFMNINEFCTHMQYLIENSRPSLPPFAKREANNGKR